MSFLVGIMLPTLEFFYQIAHNYGLAIILLTIAIKLAFYSLNAKQYESMELMKKIQPKVKALQAKLKSNPEKMQKEMMVLYKEHGVNPLGGCLPLLVQLPFLIALFATLNSPEFAAMGGTKTFLWLKDLASPDTSNLFAFLPGFFNLPLLPILVGISTYYSQKTMSVDPAQQKMMAFMPILMVVICIRLNAGVLLYWITSNLLTSAQQVYMKKQKYIKEEVAILEIEKK